MNDIREKDVFDLCPLLQRKTDMSECYDIQMVLSHCIKERILNFKLDRVKAEELCSTCPYNQLYDTTNAEAVAVSL
jgi:hypothetical protein